jgi:hypothetical protein
MPERSVKQLNVSVDAGLYDRFREKTQKRGMSMREIVEHALEVWTAHEEAAGTLHMDGNPCPLNQFITDLSQAARDQFIKSMPHN